MDMFGFKEKNTIGKKCSKAFSGPRCLSPSCPLKRILNGEERVEFELEKELKDGRKLIIIMTATPLRKHDGELIGIVERFTDITIHKQLEEERSKASKIESLGILAGGIAHDFNNFLGAVMNNIWMAKKYEKTEDELCKLMENTEEVVLRAKDLTQQLLTFSKGGALVKKTTSLSGLIKDACSFSLRGSNVKCRHSIPGDLRPAEVDEGQINQVISNLIINADQAMPEGGTINVSAENITVCSGDALPLDEGKYIKITITDQGIGIPIKHLPKIFDPYFSTKQKGSGLGLATSYSIIKKHGGHILVESEVGVGTTFKIYLPASSAKIKEKEEVLKEVPSMRGKILVMDDEGFYRDSLKKLLESFGHKVEVAADGTETIKLYKKAKKAVRPFNVVILDLTIRGGMGGKEVIERLLKIEPDVKAIVSSGYSNDPVLSDFRRYGFSGMVSKPFKIEELKGLLHSILAPEKA